MPGHQFAHVEAGQVGGDRPERPADLLRRGGFHVVGVDMRRPTGHEEQDHGRVTALVRGLGLLGPQHIGQRQPGQSQRTQFQETTPRGAVAQTVRGSEDVEHGGKFRVRRGQSISVGLYVAKAGRSKLGRRPGWRGTQSGECGATIDGALPRCRARLASRDGHRRSPATATGTVQVPGYCPSAMSKLSRRS
jgi:hypothetical protein